MEKQTFDIIMEQANGRLMTALENAIMQDTGILRQQANLLANHLLDIIEMNDEKKYKLNRMM